MEAPTFCACTPASTYALNVMPVHGPAVCCRSQQVVIVEDAPVLTEPLVGKSGPASPSRRVRRVVWRRLSARADEASTIGPVVPCLQDRRRYRVFTYPGRERLPWQSESPMIVPGGCLRATRREPPASGR